MTGAVVEVGLGIGGKAKDVPVTVGRKELSDIFSRMKTWFLKSTVFTVEI